MKRFKELPKIARNRGFVWGLGNLSCFHPENLGGRVALAKALELTLAPFCWLSAATARRIFALSNLPSSKQAGSKISRMLRGNRELQPAHRSCSRRSALFCVLPIFRCCVEVKGLWQQRVCWSGMAVCITACTVAISVLVMVRVLGTEVQLSM